MSRGTSNLGAPKQNGQQIVVQEWSLNIDVFQVCNSSLASPYSELV